MVFEVNDMDLSDRKACQGTDDVQAFVRFADEYPVAVGAERPCPSTSRPGGPRPPPRKRFLNFEVVCSTVIYFKEDILYSLYMRLASGTVTTTTDLFSHTH